MFFCIDHIVFYHDEFRLQPRSTRPMDRTTTAINVSCVFSIMFILIIPSPIIRNYRDVQRRTICFVPRNYCPKRNLQLIRGGSVFDPSPLVPEPANVYMTYPVQKVWVMGFIEGPLQIPQWRFLSFPLRALDEGCALNDPWKWFKLHFRVHRWKWSQTLPYCTLITDVKLLSTGSGANLI